MEQHPDFRQCTQGRLYQRDWAKCSLDAQAFDADGKPVIIECKTGQNAGKWNPIPDRYYAQVQWQMYVTGIRRAYFSVLICGHQWFEKVVDFNPVFVGKMLDKCFRVWDCIQLKQAPASLGFTAADKETIAAMAGQSGHSGPAKEVTDEEVAKFKALKEAADRATEEFEAFKNSLQYKMVDAQRLYRPDGRTFASWVERKGSVSVDKDKLKLKYPDIYNECLKTGAGTRYVKYTV
jgi:predicted phage-related endonuclease